MEPKTKRARALFSTFMAAVLTVTLAVPNMAFAQTASEQGGASNVAATETATPTAASASAPATQTASSATQAAASSAEATTLAVAPAEAAAATENSTAAAAVPATTVAQTDTPAASTAKNDSTSAAGATAAGSDDAAYPTGLVVDPLAIQKQNALNQSYNEAYASQSNGLSTQSAGATSTLPATYDLRNVNGTSYVTPARNQSPWNDCWAFGTTASIETNILKQNGGVGASSLNLSEHQLAYFAENPINSATVIAGRTVKGDQAGEGVYAKLSAGGSIDIAAQALTSWEGIASESQNSSLVHKASDGTIRTTSDWSLAEALRATSAARAVDYDKLPTPATIGVDASGQTYTYTHNEAGVDAIKRAVMSTGSVATSIHYDEDAADYNDKTGSLYVGKFVGSNHVVSIVGWNDNYAASKFSKNPGHDGAFLIKNSYGSYGSYEHIPVYVNGGATSTSFTKRMYTDSSGNQIYAYVDTDGEYGAAGSLYEITYQNGTYTLDTSHAYATGLALVDDSSPDLVYKTANGTTFTLARTKLAGTEGSPTWDGYFWISYYDWNYTDACSFTAEVPDSAGTYSNDHIYEYDYLGLSSRIATSEGAFDTTVNGAQSTTEAAGSQGAADETAQSASATVVAQCANVFTAVGNEMLTAVSAATQSAQNTVEVFIYRLVNGAKSPTQSATGQPEITTVYTAANAGYHTITLPRALYLHAGESFSVVERIINAQGQGYVPLELSATPMSGLDKSSIPYTAKVGAGESYISTDGGTTWIDASTLSLAYVRSKVNPVYAMAGIEVLGSGNVMIRAFTKDWTPAPTPAPTPTPAAAAGTAEIAPSSVPLAASAAPAAELPKTADESFALVALLVLLMASGLGTACIARRKVACER